MNPLEFEKLIKPLNREKYHISRAIKFKDNMPYIDEWVIYRKDMPLEEFYDSNNIPVLSSAKGNTIEDIKKLIEAENGGKINGKKKEIRKFFNCKRYIGK